MNHDDKNAEQVSRKIRELEQQLVKVKQDLLTRYGENEELSGQLAKGRSGRELELEQYVEKCTVKIADLESQNIALMTAAMRYQWLCANRDVLLITGIFGNGCVNKTISDVNNFIDSKLAIQPTADLLAERDRKRDADLLKLTASKFAFDYYNTIKLKNIADARLDGSWNPKLENL